MFVVFLTPGKIWQTGDLLDAAGLNLTANPTIQVGGDFTNLTDFNFVAAVGKVFTVTDFPNDLIESVGHGITTNGQRVLVSSTGTLPNGLLASTTWEYFARVITIDQITLHHTAAGALDGSARVDVTDGGSGVHTLTYTPLATGQPLIFNSVTSKWENGIIPPSALPEMVGATSTANGVRGAVPQPLAGDQADYLGGDGMWHSLPVPQGVQTAHLIFFARNFT